MMPPFRGLAPMGAMLLAVGLLSCRERGEDATPTVPGVGTTWRVVTWTSDPWGVNDRRESWRVLEADTLQTRLWHERDGMEPREEHRGWRARSAFGDDGATVRGTRRDGARLESIRVPAGRFRCARTTRTFEARDGAMMAVDEWWSPDVPVPVQRWTRWSHYATDTLRNPPRRPEDLPVGTAWAVLEKVDAR